MSTSTCASSSRREPSKSKPASEPPFCFLSALLLTVQCPSRNVKFFTDLPESSLVDVEIGTHHTYLDTLGRTSLTLKARNLVDEFRDRQLYISYDYSFAAGMRKPLVVFGSMLLVFVAAWAIGSLEFGFSR